MAQDKDMHFSRGKPDIYGDAHPKALLRQIVEDGDLLKPFANQHIISTRQFDRKTWLQLFRLTAKYECNPERYSTPLQGKILISAFYEPSTRTRLSFESAWHRLGGDIMSITDRATTGIAKGESLQDIGEMFNNYGDCVVLRDNHENSVRDMTETLRIPIINAGNGIDEHPTQALSDLYAIFKWRPQLSQDEVPAESKIHLGIVGLPCKMRTVRSLLYLCTHFPQVFSKITLIHEPMGENDVFDQSQLAFLEQAGLDIHTTTNMQEILPDLDVVYINAIAWIGDNYLSFGESFKLSAQSPLKPGSIVLHPLARGDELDTSLDNTEHNWYFSQARGAVFLRMALLTCMVQRVERVVDVI